MEKRIKDIIKDFGPYLVIIVIVIIIKAFFVSPIRVSGDSMDSTLKNNDVMILNKIGYRLNGVKRFDFVVVDYNGRYLIKRVIGLPGDTLKVINNKLFINEEYVDEPYLDKDTVTMTFFIEEKIPDGEYFLMGDNRGSSLDSRELGTFSEDEILGIASYTIFPFNRIGSKK